ncbi:hypothetical protein Ciccas_007067 [Cichlidogyrus casuarinus]|uniref:Uncharacterized protein n=1 Tax=Cichlidogyrus casuarinus TaxID=1844966 RepID=A0ABD2Q3Z6_9PLAT
MSVTIKNGSKLLLNSHCNFARSNLFLENDLKKTGSSSIREASSSAREDFLIVIIDCINITRKGPTN